MIVKHISRETKAVADAAVSLATTIINRMRYVDIQVQTAPVRVTFDGSTTPVGGATGKLWTPGSTYRVWGEKNMENLKFIRDGSTSASLDVDFWGEP